MHTGFDLPLRIDVASGERLEPTGLDPYSLPWVQGAASTVPLRVKRLYAERLADLRERLSVLRSKRTKDTDDFPAWGPRRRDQRFVALDQVPLPSDGVVWGPEAGAA